MTATPATSSNVPVLLGMLAAAGTFGLGAISFLIAGFEGHSAGWEMLAIPTGLSLCAGMVAAICAVIALVQKKYGGGLVTLGLAGFGALLGLVGFVLGA